MLLQYGDRLVWERDPKKIVYKINGFKDDGTTALQWEADGETIGIDYETARIHDGIENGDIVLNDERYAPPLCPNCEHGPIALPDYLCKECRYG